MIKKEINKYIYLLHKRHKDTQEFFSHTRQHTGETVIVYFSVPISKKILFAKFFMAFIRVSSKRALAEPTCRIKKNSEQTACAKSASCSINLIALFKYETMITSI